VAESPAAAVDQEASMDIAGLQRQSNLYIRQRITLMINRYEVWAADHSGNQTSMVGFVEQKRMAMREQVTVYTDESRSAVLTRFTARQVFDLGATYDVADSSGASIGTFRKDFARSLLRSTWHMEQPGIPDITGRERSLFVALLRRFSDLDFLPYHFDFSADAAPAFSVEKKWGLRDMYVVRIDNPQLDRRVVIAMAVALDALQGR
jgi:uncharacterized protein YxjI